MDDKTEKLKKLFSSTDEKQVYKEVMAFGEKFTTYPKKDLKPENLVEGCQSSLYLSTQYKDGKIKFYVQSDALISRGLAAILIYLYSDEDPKKLFTHPPLIFKECPALKKISLNRQLGISNLFKKMQKAASSYI